MFPSPTAFLHSTPNSVLRLLLGGGGAPPNLSSWPYRTFTQGSPVNSEVPFDCRAGLKATQDTQCQRATLWSFLGSAASPSLAKAGGGVSLLDSSARQGSVLGALCLFPKLDSAGRPSGAPRALGAAVGGGRGPRSPGRGAGVPARSEPLRGGGSVGKVGAGAGRGERYLSVYLRVPPAPIARRSEPVAGRVATRSGCPLFCCQEGA